MYLWTDLETTGLDPAGDSILEAAFLITYADLRGEIKPRNFLVEPTLETRRIIAETMNPVVLKMHTDNGLLADLDNPEVQKLPLAEIEQQMLDVIRTYEETTGEGTWYLAGASVHFDKGFLAHHMPELHSQLHHRILDTSSTRLFFDAAGQTFDLGYTNERPHRADSDIMETLDFARSLALWTNTASDALDKDPSPFFNYLGKTEASNA